jgi:hypothetical protein
MKDGRDNQKNRQAIKSSRPRQYLMSKTCLKIGISQMHQD